MGWLKRTVVGEVLFLIIVRNKSAPAIIAILLALSDLLSVVQAPSTSFSSSACVEAARECL